MQIINTIKAVTKQAPQYKKWEQSQDDKEARRAYLANTMPISKEELEYADTYGRTIINAINIMDEKSEDAATKVEMATDCLIAVSGKAILLPFMIYTLIKSSNGTALNRLNAVSEGAVTAFIIPPVLMVGKAWATTVQVFASKMAREKAREEDLSDSRNFVLYNQSQIEQARKTFESKKDSIKKDKNYNENPLNAFSMFTKLLKEKKEYKQKINLREENVKLQQISLLKEQATPEELKRAEKDKETILRTIKHINNKAEDYSENIETATGAFLGMGLIADGLFSALGFLTGSFISSKATFLPNSVKKHISTFTAGTFFAAGILAELIIASNIKIKSGQVGRFIAKQELLSDPKNFLSFTKEELDKVQQEPEPKTTKRNGIINAINFLKQTRKDFKLYKEYKINTLPKEKAFIEELKKTDITAEQLNEAKTLQNNLFKSFEAVDNKSQQYSEDIEFSTQLAKGLKRFMPMITALTTAAATALFVKSGLIDKNKVAGFLTKNLFNNDKALKESLIKTYDTVAVNFPNLKGLLAETLDNLHFNDLNTVLSKYEETFKDIFDEKTFNQIMDGKNITKETFNEVSVKAKKQINELLDNRKFQELMQSISNEISSDNDIEKLIKTKFLNPDNSNLSANLCNIITAKKLNEILTSSNVDFTSLKSAITKLAKDFSSNQTGKNILSNVGTLKDAVNKNSVTKKILNNLEKDLAALISGDKKAPFPITLLATGAGLFITALNVVLMPVLITTFAINYTIESFFTSLQKTAGKIGVMEAVNELDNPRYFLGKEQLTPSEVTSLEEFLIALKK